MNDSVTADVMEVFNRAVEHYNGKDVERLLECFTPDLATHHFAEQVVFSGK